MTMIISPYRQKSTEELILQAEELMIERGALKPEWNLIKVGDEYFFSCEYYITGDDSIYAGIGKTIRDSIQNYIDFLTQESKKKEEIK